jgi:hypothetical protein
MWVFDSKTFGGCSTGKGITMRSSQGTNKEKQKGPKVKAKGPANEIRDSQQTPQLDDTTDASTSPIGHVVTEEQYRARVSQKAYELYEKRQAATPLGDWVEAERLVKTELIAEGQWAGTV